MYLVVHLSHGAADLKQSAAGIIRHGVVSKDTAPDLAGKGDDRLQKIEGFIQRIPCRFLRIPLSVLFYFSGSLQKRHDLKKLAHAENASDLQPFGRAADVPDSSKGQTAFLVNAAKCVGGLCLCLYDICKRIGRHERFTELFCACGCGMLCQYMNNLIIFQFF